MKTAEDIRALKGASVNGVLIGETFMRCKDKKATFIRTVRDFR